MNEPNPAPVDILRGARALLAKRGGWIKGESVMRKSRITEDGREVNVRMCYCATGAVEHAGLEQGAHPTADGIAFSRLAAHVPTKQPYLPARVRIVEWNDKSSTTKAQVLAAFDAAIADLSDSPEDIDRLVQGA